MCAAAMAVVLAVVVLTGCSNAQLKRTPITQRPTPWFCQINESRDDWQCVQDAELAAHPRPERLPNDPVEVTSAPESTDAAAAAGLSPLADPSADIDPGRLDDAPMVLDDASELLALSEDGFAVQIYATATRPLAESFVADHGLTEPLILQLARDSEFYYVVLLGAFGSYEEAQAAADDRPDALSDIMPWIRPLLSIQTGILAARELRTRVDT